MATNNRGKGRGVSHGRGGRNNNPEGHNQYSGMMSNARDNPLATAAAIGGAVAAGVFLWSRRNQISDQIGNLTKQINEWREGMESGGELTVEDKSSGNAATPSSDRKCQAEISEEALTLKMTGESS